jgi:hypothetical protein
MPRSNEADKFGPQRVFTRMPWRGERAPHGAIGAITFAKSQVLRVFGHVA